jgi:hypothetical protein
MIEPPEGWKLEREPDETLRIAPDARLKRAHGATTLWAGLIIAGLCCALLAGGGITGRMKLLPIPAVFLPIGLIILFQGLWEVFGDEAWRVRVNFLEVEQTLFRYRRAYRFQDATLKLVFGTNERYPELPRPLSSSTSSAWWGLLVVDRSGRRCLRSYSRTSSRKEDLRGLVLQPHFLVS